MFDTFLNSSLYLQYLYPLIDLEVKQLEHKEKILAEWKKSANYPRKKKKAVRKRLNLEYSIVCWNPEYNF